MEREINPYQNHPSCVELRLLLSRHNIKKIQLADEAAMSVASISQYCRGNRVPPLRVLESLRESIDRIIRRHSGNSSRHAHQEIQQKVYLARFQERIMQLARKQGWIAWYFHDDEYTPLGIVMIREIIFVALLRTKRRAVPAEVTDTLEALKAAGLNEPPLPEVARQHSKVAIWEVTPDQWPAVERILTHPRKGQ